MLVQSCVARDIHGREVTMDNVWRIRIPQGVHRYRFVIAPVFPVPKKNRGAGC